MFKRLEPKQYPTRQWALFGDPACGKSTFAAQMAAPLLLIDADHRFQEVAHLAHGDIFEISEQAQDHVNAESIAKLLEKGMQGAGVKTIIVDSLTSIISPLVVEAILDNEAGRNKNRVAAFKEKALAMRLLQDTITGFGCDTLWIYHTRQGLDSQAAKVETTTISTVELARLRRSLNMVLKMEAKSGRRSVCVDWARRGRQGISLTDDSGAWEGMPAKIEQAVYGGLTAEQMKQIEQTTPRGFSGPQQAIAWGWEQGCFNDALHAQNAYDELKREQQPKSAPEMWALWIADVRRRQAEQGLNHAKG